MSKNKNKNKYKYRPSIKPRTSLVTIYYQSEYRQVDSCHVDVVKSASGTEKFYWWEYGHPGKGYDEIQATRDGNSSYKHRHRVVVPYENDKAFLRDLDQCEETIVLKPWESLTD